MQFGRWFACGTATVGICGIVTALLSAQEPRQAFRTTTRLIEVSVVVVDRDGNPVTNLGREDFTLTEDRVKQPIGIFQVSDTRPAVGPTTAPLPIEEVRTFSNRVEQSSGATTVILFDRLNAAFDSQWFARKHVDNYLKASRAGDRFALYVLDGPLRVLHDFTTDHALLRKALDQYSARSSAHYDASNEPPAPVPAGGIAVWLADPSGNMAEFFTERRTWQTFDALRALAGHLSGIGGRKSVVWLSEAFVMPDRLGRPEFLFRMRQATRALNDAHVTLYPVDARGLVGAQTASGGRVTFTTFAGVRGNIETMEVVADETGGRAFANSNALDLSIRRAVDDSRFTYLLGYYPSDTKWDGRFRTISVEVKRKGLTVRHRRGYVAAAVPATDERARTAALREALQGPLQSTKVGLQVSTERLGDSQVNLMVRIDPATLRLERDGTGWRGAVDLLFADVSRNRIGTISDTAKLGITLSDEGRVRASREWLPVARTISLRPETFQIRVVARDVASGDVGSIVIPASQLK
jgi:VWFA-related protein